MAAKFWGVEVKPGESVNVKPEAFKILHLSQAALGEVKDNKVATSVTLRLKIGNKNYVIGELSAVNRPQLMFDLVFKKQFQLSHNWKNGSIFFLGYVADDPCAGYDGFSDGENSSDEEENLPVNGPVNGQLPKIEKMKPAEKVVASFVQKFGESSKSEDFSEDSDEPEDDSAELSDSSLEDADLSDFSDEDELDFMEETPPKPALPRKRSVESDRGIPVSAKPTPAKTGGKKDPIKAPNASKLDGKSSAVASKKSSKGKMKR